MRETITNKEWKAQGNGLKRHKDLDAVETELAWQEERGKTNPLLAEYDGLRKKNLHKRCGELSEELDRLWDLGRMHELERELKIEISFDTEKR